MAGINRLGKAPPKPGTLRPADPNKYKTVDMFSEGAEADMDYIRTVKDIEEMQQQQGWLFGRGAFDKADLLYLRDTMEQQRHLELELRDTERNQFASLRAQLDKEHDDPKPGAAGARPPKRERETNIRVQPKVGPSVVPKGRPRPPPSDNRGGATATSSAPSEKKPRVDAAASGAGRPQAEVPPRTAAANPSNSGGSERSGGDGGGLQGLLGGYGSDSDQSDSGDGGSSHPPPQQQPQQQQPQQHQKQETGAGTSATVRPPVAVALPSAADLLDSSKPVSSTLGPPRGADSTEKVDDEVDDAVLSDFLF